MDNEYERSQMSEKTEFLLFDILKELRIISKKLDTPKEVETITEVKPIEIKEPETKEINVSEIKEVKHIEIKEPKKPKKTQNIKKKTVNKVKKPIKRS